MKTNSKLSIPSKWFASGSGYGPPFLSKDRNVASERFRLRFSRY